MASGKVHVLAQDLKKQNKYQLVNSFIMEPNLVVKAGTEQDVLSGGVPLDVAHPPLVSMEVHDPLRQVRLQTILRDTPHLDLNTQKYT